MNVRRLRVKWKRRRVLPGVLLLLIGVVTDVSFAMARQAGSLAQYHNRNRLILVFAPDAQDKRYLRQQQAWSGEAGGLRERDLIRFDVFASGASRRGQEVLSTMEANALRQRYGVGKDRFRVVLVGKDGHAALSSASPVTARRLFQLIDAMPMRRDETRKRHEQR